MPGQPKRFCRRLAVHLPGWFFFVCGLTLIGPAVLLPVRRDVVELQWRRDLMQDQAQQLGEQCVSYRQFQTALANDDPIVLERLAYYQLHLKPVGTEPLAPPGERSTLTWASAPAPGESQAPDWDNVPTIEAMLHRPLPREGVDCRPPQPPNSRLTRLTRGTSRLMLLGVGLAFVYVGMLLPIGEQRSEG